jgi:hypothetical protein
MKLFKLMEWLFPSYFQMHVAAAVVGGAVVSGVMSSDASKSAADTQANAANNAAQTNWNMYNQTRSDQAPWRQAGSNALSAIQNGFGLSQTPSQSNFNSAAYLAANPDVAADPYYKNNPYQHYVDHGQSEGRQFTSTAPANTGGVGFGQFNHTFDANDLKNGLAPNYDFQLQQGMGAINNQASMTGGLVGGNALKGINDYAQNYASGAYQQAFNNYNTNQTNIYNRLANIAGLGQTANGQTAQAGTAIAGNVGSAQLAAGASQAAGTMGSANAISGAVNNAAGWYAGNQFLNNGSSGISVPSSGSYANSDFLTS